MSSICKFIPLNLCLKTKSREFLTTCFKRLEFALNSEYLLKLRRTPKETYRKKR